MKLDIVYHNIRILPIVCLISFCWFLCFDIYIIDASKYLLKNKSGCSDADQHRIDKLALKFYSSSTYLPTNYQELKPFCKDLRNVSKSIENFMLQCYTKEVVQFSKILFYTINKQLRYYCMKRSKKLTQLLKLAPCLNEHFRTENICWKNWLRDFSMLPDVSNDKNKIIYACCTTANGYRCMDDLFEKYECSRKNKLELLDFIFNILNDVLNMACGEYNQNTDACETKKTFKFVMKSNSSKNNNRRQQAFQFETPLFVLIDLMDSFVDPDIVVG